MNRSTPFIHFKSIVCGVDFSPHSTRALQYAALLARVNRASLTAVYAVDPVLSTAAAAAYIDPARLRHISSSNTVPVERY